MRHHTAFLAVVLLGMRPPAVLAAQATNPPYLSEMPPVERILREIRGADADQTAARQMGTFLQFKGMIETMAGGRRYRNELTPDEQRLIGAYYGAYWEIAKTKPEYQKFTGLKGFDIDPAWRKQLFDQYFSPEFRAVYDGVEADYARRIAARAKADTQSMMRARAEVAEYEQKQSAKGQEQRTLARCIASGRTESQCLSEGLVKGFKDLFAAALPTALTKTVTGLRMSGVYAGQSGVGITFWDPHAVVACGQLVADERAYAVAIKGNQLAISIGTSPKIFEVLQGESPLVVLTLGADGRLTGPGPTDITGRVIVGYREWTRHYDDGRVVPMREAIYENRTVRCDVGLLPLNGASPAIVTVSQGLEVAFNVLSGEQAIPKPAPTGLRLSGEFGTQDAFDLEFHSHAVIVGCGEAVVARDYAVRVQGAQVVVRVQHGATPFTITYRPDGMLAGTGSVPVTGRKLAGTDANGDLVWAPAAGTCSLGVLAPAGQPGTTAQVAATPTPAPSASVAAPVAAGAVANATLSLATGFPTAPNGANPLKESGFFLNRTSLESNLAAAVKPAPGSTALKTIIAACERQAPECSRLVPALTTNGVAVLRTDAGGNGQFAPVPAGTYFLVGVTVYEKRPVIWDLRVDLKPGANSVTLDLHNAAVGN